MASIVEEIYCPICGWKPDNGYYKRLHIMVPEKCPDCGHLLKRRIKLERNHKPHFS